MREIKFRGKDPNGEWTYGNLVYIQSPKHGYSTGIQMHSGDGYRPWAGIEVEPETVGQFTGLQDKNGRDIYEGDVLQGKRKRKFIVTWNNDIGSWVNRPTDNGTSYPCFNIGTVTGLEVIGNIHDNPELLEAQT